MAKLLNTIVNGGSSEAASAPAPGQATLSAIGDVSIAAEEVVQGSTAAARCTRWLTIAVFMILLYDATNFIVASSLGTSPFIQVFSGPLLTVVVAGLVFWRRQVWKLRSKA